MVQVKISNISENQDTGYVAEKQDVGDAAEKDDALAEQASSKLTPGFEIAGILVAVGAAAGLERKSRK
jgi:hypothetical protein